MTRAELRHARLCTLAFAAFIYASGWLLIRHGANFSPRLVAFPPWSVLPDFLLTVPAMSWWLHRHDRKKAWHTALGMAAGGMWVGIHLLSTLPMAHVAELRALRALLLAIVAAIEVQLIVRLLHFVAAQQGGNPEYALQHVLEQRMGEGLLCRALGFELRIWLHALAPRRWVWRYRGDEHFSYHHKDGYALNLQGWMVLLVIGAPAQHLLLELWHPWLAWVTDALTLYSLMYLLAHYRACLHCPVSLATDALLLRHGISMCEQTIPLPSILTCELSRDIRQRRVPGVLNLAGAGRSNVRIELREPLQIERFYGVVHSVCTIYLGLDNAPQFVAALGRFRAAGETGFATACLHQENP